MILLKRLMIETTRRTSTMVKPLVSVFIGLSFLLIECLANGFRQAILHFFWHGVRSVLFLEWQTSVNKKSSYEQYNNGAHQHHPLGIAFGLSNLQFNKYRSK